MTCVLAPASTANLGPGFDVLGLALTRHAWVSDSAEPSTGTDGAERAVESEPCGPDHIARIAYEAAGGVGQIWFGFDFPPSRGMGFSSAARAAGVILAFIQTGMSVSDARIAGYPVVAELEGHGDNAAPAVFGGLHVVGEDFQHRMALEMPGQLICWVPHNATTPTDASRSVMPTDIGRVDAVFNLGRVGLLISALYESDLSLLALATQDRLHQPARLAAAPDSKVALDSALAAGASAAWLSGSGPTIAIVAEPAKVEVIQAALPAGGDVLLLDTDLLGARLA